MLAKVYSCAMIGLDGVLVEVEVDIAQGLPAFTVVGLGDTAVQESRERVRALRTILLYTQDNLYCGTLCYQPLERQLGFLPPERHTC